MRESLRVPRPRYDWVACGVSIGAAFAVAIPAGLLVYRLIDSGGLMSAVFVLLGTWVSRVVYSRVARRGSRRIDDETCAL